MTIYWAGSPKFTAGHPAPLIALVHHRMVGTLRSTDAAFTSTDGREASTHFGVRHGCGRAGHPTTAHVHQYVRLGDQAWGNGNWDPSGAWDDRYCARRLLGDGRFAGVARSQQAEIENMPAPESVVPVLEALVN